MQVVRALYRYEAQQVSSIVAVFRMSPQTGNKVRPKEFLKNFPFYLKADAYFLQKDELTFEEGDVLYIVDKVGWIFNCLNL